MSTVISKISDSVTFFRVLNRVSKRFENFWPIPKGTSYNFYLVEGREKKALIDGVDAAFSEDFFRALSREIDLKELDYIITQHTEPDHSGTIAELMRRAPKALLLGTKQAITIGESLADYPKSRFREVKEGERLYLGDRTLRFIVAPMIHWPDTMMTYLEEENILFTCDLFGSHLASEKLYLDEDDFELIDYYASILMPYSGMVERALSRVKELKPKLIAPSHGALHRDIDSIIKIYEDWASWRPKGRALVLVGSQYGNAEALAREAARGLEEEGLKAIVVDSAEAGPDDLLALTLDSAAILIASSTHNGRPFLGVRYYLDLLEEYKPKNRVSAIIGTFGWGGGALKSIRESLESLKIPVIGEMEVKGKPRDDDLREARELGRLLGVEARKLIERS
ncbi:MAG: FprA family A-type flavoprotein [Candidatus Korarchaeum sp.]|nr:FprA family A-type flavoprotein [Candidatus Korarchaeum sp.]MDW8035823.1 FprA family A-type flavoprotein [Candidatus Korarchaeum sp.]